MSNVVSPTSSSGHGFYCKQPCHTFIMDTSARGGRLSNEEDSRKPLPGDYCAGTNQKHSFESVECGTSEMEAVNKYDKIANDFDENDGLSLEVKYALTTNGQSGRSDRRIDNRVLCVQRNNETRIADQFTEQLNAKSNNCFVPAVPDEYDCKKLNVNERNVHWKCYRNKVGRPLFPDAGETGDIFVFKEHKTRRYINVNREVSRADVCRCILDAPLKRATRMASPGGASNSGCDKSLERRCSFGTGQSSTVNCDSSVELEFRSKAGCEESLGRGRPARLLSDILISGRAFETKTETFAKRRPAVDELFLINSNRYLSQAPKHTRFLGVIPLIKHCGKDASFSLSTKHHLPSISAKSGTSSGQVLTVVRQTVTGLEIEQRSSTEIISIPSAPPRSCDTNARVEYDPARVKKRTINWVKSQRLLQSRIKV